MLPVRDRGGRAIYSQAAGQRQSWAGGSKKWFYEGRLVQTGLDTRAGPARPHSELAEHLITLIGGEGRVLAW
jgi:hypothetical protein